METLPDPPDPKAGSLSGLPAPCVDELDRALVRQRVREKLLGAAQAPQRIGRYAVLRKLGSGGMGVVYAGYDEELGRKVAIKVVRPSDGEASTRGWARLRKEAQALARLSHPNVVAVHEVGSVDDGTFVAMELVEGETVRAWLAKETRRWQDIVEVFVQAGRGLAAAHAAGLVHRDFKPDNLMISAPGAGESNRVGRARVMDFGLARPDTEQATKGEAPADAATVEDGVTPLTRTGALVGTPAYMSPEQFAGEALGPATDQFSFCVALFEALCGERPFAGTSVPAVALAIARGEIRSMPVAVPRRLRKILRRGLSVDAEHRFASMTALVAALGTVGRARRLWIAAAMGVGLLTVARLLMSPEEGPCVLAAQRMEASWGPEQRAAVTEGLRASGVADADYVAEATAIALDDYALTWSDARTRACEATRVQQVQSEGAMDLRMRCLDDRATQFETLVGVLQNAEREVGGRAVLAVTWLPTLVRCDDLDALAAAVAIPEDPALAQAVSELRDQVQELEVLRNTGRFPDGLVKAEAALERSKDVAHAPTQAAVLAAYGHMQSSAGDHKVASETLKRAYFSAVASGHRRVAQATAMNLAFVEGVQFGDTQAGLRWGRQALAWAQWLKARGETEGRTHLELAKIYNRSGDTEAANREAFEALEILQETLGADHPRVAGVHLVLGQVAGELRDLKRAREHLKAAHEVQARTLGESNLFAGQTLVQLGRIELLARDADASANAYLGALGTFEDVYPPDHTNIAVVLANLAGARRAQGRYDDALKLMQRARKIFETKLGPDHPNVGHIIGAIAAIHLKKGDFEQARPMLERSLAIAEKTLGPDHFNVAAALEQLGTLSLDQGDPEVALQHFERAVAIWSKKAGADSPGAASALVGVGAALLGAKRYDDAASVLERALKQVGTGTDTKPAYVQGNFRLAQAYGHLGRTSTAREHAQAALKVGREIESPTVPTIEAWIAANSQPG